MVLKLLELFSGTGSIGKVAVNQNFEITSLDKDMEATIKTDILDWNYKTYPTKYFDVYGLVLHAPSTAWPKQQD